MHGTQAQGGNAIGRAYLLQAYAGGGLYQRLRSAVHRGVPRYVGVRHRLHLAASTFLNSKSNVGRCRCRLVLVAYQALRTRYHRVHYHHGVYDVVRGALEQLVDVSIEEYLLRALQRCYRLPLVRTYHRVAVRVVTARFVRCTHVVVHRDRGRRVRGIVLRRGRHLYQVAVRLPAYLVARLNYHVVGLRRIGFRAVLLRFVSVEYAACHLRTAVVLRTSLLSAEHRRHALHAAAHRQCHDGIAPHQQFAVVRQHTLRVRGYVLRIALERLYV